MRDQLRGLARAARDRYSGSEVEVLLPAMPTLLCVPSFAHDPDWQSRFLAEVVSLRESGEPVTLWSADSVDQQPMMVDVTTLAEVEAVMEDEEIPVLVSPARPPDWLALDEFGRILLICPEAGPENGNFLVSEWPGLPVLPAERQALIRYLLHQGGEAVDLVQPGDALDLSQSWCSGRRVGVRLLADAGEGAR